MTSILQQLPFTIDLESWRSYYDLLCTEYSDSRWTWQKTEQDLSEVVKDTCTNPQERAMRGWMLQTNRTDQGEPSILANSRGEAEWTWRQLPLGPIQSLAAVIPYVYRWTVYEMPPQGITPAHVDPNERVLLIPLYWPEKGQEFLLEREGVWEDWSDSFRADGRVLLLDGHIPHWTCNRSDQVRVNIMARMPRHELDHILSVTDAF